MSLTPDDLLRAGRAVGGSPTDRLITKQATDQRDLERKSDDELMSEWEGRYGKADRAQKPAESLWKQNIAFVEGIQHIMAEANAMVNVQAHAQDRVVDNRILDMVRRLQARLDQPDYRPIAESDTNLPEHHEVAKLSQALLRNFYKRRKVKREKRMSLFWLLVCGHFYLEPFFDDSAGRLVDTPKIDPLTKDLVMEEVPDPVTGQMVSRPVIVKEREGLADFVTRSAFQVKRDYRTQKFGEIQWVIVDETPPREQVILRYADSYAERNPGKDLEKELPKVDKIQTLPFIPEVSGLGGGDTTGLPRPVPAADDISLIRRCYELPSKKYPKGRHIIYNPTGRILLHRGDLKSGRIPLFMVAYLLRPWVMEGMAPTSQARILQRMINYVFGRWWMHLRAWAGGWPLIPITAGINRDSWTNEIGTGLFYNPAGGKPEFLTPPFGNLVAYEKFLARAENSMEERLALPPALRGQLPKGAKAAKMVELLQEAADQVQQPVLADIADAFSEFYTEELVIMHRHYTVERILEIVGADKKAAAEAFKKMSEEELLNAIDVRVAAGETLPASRAIRREVIADMSRKDKIFGEPGTPEHRRQYLEAIGVEEGTLAGQDDLDASIADDENFAILAGEQVHLRPGIDDSRVHIIRHVSFAKQLIVAGREMEATKLLPHIEEHRKDLAAQLARAQMTPGPPHPGGAPGNGKGQPHGQMLVPGMEPQPTKHGPEHAKPMG